ncbi:MAG: penicillin-binding protein 2 [Bacteroidota bacterium]
MAIDHHKDRATIIKLFFGLATLVILGQLLNLQVINKDFRRAAEAAGSSTQIEYPSRGLIFDRNNKLLVVNKPIYDILFVFNQFEPHAAKFDTTKFCQLLGITEEYFIAALDKNWNDIRYSKSKPQIFLTRITHEQYASFQESLYEFKGFSIQERNARAYPHRNAAHLLGYIGEVDTDILNDSLYYRRGDYMGISGLEHQYEYYLRGAKGNRLVEKDIQGRVIGKVAGGTKDVTPTAGQDIFSTIDLDLQTYAEELMAGKIGGIVAIEPATGEILSMVSTPNYEPAKLSIGVGRGRHYAELLNDSLQPFFNRAIQAQYPPGSLFKPLVALIGLQEGTLTPDRGIRCQGAYFLNGTRLTGCHAHPYCGTVAAGIQHSCNAYFVSVFREIVDQYADEKTPRRGLEKFNTYLRRFGMGNSLGLDFPGEKEGNVPTPSVYDAIYAQETGWKSVWIRSLGIGQGELLATNLQLANIAAAIANRGYYITPHLTRALRTPDGKGHSAPLSLEKRMTGIDPQHFEPVIDGMELVVQAGTARAAQIPGIAVCGKTGTAENSQRGGKDHSIFFAFAPKDDPKIAIAVYIENGGFGGTYAAPITSLLIERYIKGEVSDSRLWLEDRMKNANLIGRP